MAQPAFYQQDAKIIADYKKQLTENDKKLTELYARWETLEGKKL
mgnify:CR=1 FL=1